MKKIYLQIIIILTICTTSFAETKEELVAKYVLENMQQDYISCYIFYKIGAEVVKKSNKNGDIAKGIEKSAPNKVAKVVIVKVLIFFNLL